MSSLLTISEVVRRSGVAASALRFYEERGLVSPNVLAQVTVGIRGRFFDGLRSLSSLSAWV